MKKYICFFKEDYVDDFKNTLKKKGCIYAILDQSNGMDNCLEIDITQTQWENIFDYLYVDGKLLYDEEGVEKRRLHLLRKDREAVLVAFDKYNMAVTRGIIRETDHQKTDIMDWYHKVLDLKEEEIKNPLPIIQYFMQQS